MSAEANYLNIDLTKKTIRESLFKAVELLKLLNSTAEKTRESSIAQTEAETALLWFKTLGE